ncbi:MAG: peptidyl-prolyl cis-trans isomerase [Thermoanaerobaculia bacterium]|nr:peptidyl-prolyl cis-trans isomerase [Thermoanaerobaculia bacterium]
MPIRRFLLPLLLVLAASAVFAATSNRVILRVNDRIATLYDYEVRLTERLRAIQQADLDPTRRSELMDQAGEEVLGTILEELLVLSRADQIGYRPSEEELDSAVRRTMQNFGIESEEQFEAALRSSGMTREDFRRQIGVNLRVSGVMAREVQRRVELTEEDLRRYYYEHPEEFTTPERVELREFVVLESSSLGAEERRRLASELRDRIAAGEAMAEVIAPHRDRGTTSDVVELGWVKQGDLDPDLEAAVWDLEAGTVSLPVEGRGGLHVLEVIDREEATLLPFNEVADQIDRIERERLLRQEYEGYLEELRDAAYIRIHQLPPGAEEFDVAESASRLRVEGSAMPGLGSSIPEEASPEEASLEESAESEEGGESEESGLEETDSEESEVPRG